MQTPMFDGYWNAQHIPCQDQPAGGPLYPFGSAHRGAVRAEYPKRRFRSAKFAYGLTNCLAHLDALFTPAELKGCYPMGALKSVPLGSWWRAWSPIVVEVWMGRI